VGLRDVFEHIADVAAGKHQRQLGVGAVPDIAQCLEIVAVGGGMNVFQMPPAAVSGRRNVLGGDHAIGNVEQHVRPAAAQQRDLVKQALE
jgi:hypothetical protein